ncbi:MAG TPA: tetratricopeptide repeat protein [bacterium]|jgi:hypothetical protein|nr:tetratricopeptide repeat protein [bacterium]
MKKYFYLLVLSLLVLASKVSAQDDPAKQALLQGNQYYQSQNYVEAEKSLLSAIQLNANYAAAYQLLGNVYFAEGKKDQAMAEYRQTLVLQPDNAALKAFVDSQQPAAATAAAPSAPATAAPTAAPTQTASAPSSDLDKVHGVFAGFVGLSLGADAFNQPSYIYSAGTHGGSFLGLAFDRHFSVGLKTSFDSFSVSYAPYSFGGVTYPATSAGSSTFINVMSSCKYVFLNSGFRPYVTLGLGTDILVNTYTYGNYSQATTIPVIELGVGGTLPLSREWDIFAEIDYDELPQVVYSTYNSISYIPINIGVQFNAY